MYVRTVQRKNGDGSVVRYLQLAHSIWDPDRKRSTTKVLCSLGREDALDKEGLARLVRSMSRLLDPDKAIVATSVGEVSLLDSRPMGVGFRPTPGLMPKWPTGSGFTYDASGPMRRRVRVDDVALLLRVLAGDDPRVAFALRVDGAAREPA